ncbi:hypothetical protein [Catenisphaera adipataccumulans]|jgi:hypothetical protein|uniref:Uncharacterized protein n=1 Tax=Catenisphaera adipataccumulans TaxID=700500 RepID=A0A7W8CXY3_9FIRM|nr:hypothetical protein [Catenisphaera adipataccumulans]MBB5182000.1 hypothetical protein [Catenisphaera adipataccumulans]
MNVFDEHHDPVQLPDSLCVLVLLDSLKKAKVQAVLDRWLTWQPYFEKIRIPVYIITPERVPFHSLSPFFFVWCPDGTAYEEMRVIKDKSVFGRTVKIIYSYAFVMEQGKCLMIQRRMSETGIANLFRFVLRREYQRLLKNVEKKIDKDKQI